MILIVKFNFIKSNLKLQIKFVISRAVRLSFVANEIIYLN